MAERLPSKRFSSTAVRSTQLDSPSIVLLFFSVITYSWPFTNTSKNDKLKTENRFYVPFITQGTLQEFFFLVLVFVFFPSSSLHVQRVIERMAQSQQKKKCPQESHVSPPLDKILPRHCCIVSQRNITDRWGGKGKGFSLLQPGPVLRHIWFTAWHLDWD